MNHIHSSQIKVPDNRVRREFNQKRIEELADSIESKGLLHPIVIRLNAELEAIIVAGERRLRAMEHLHSTGRRFSVVSSEDEMFPVPPGEVPYNLLSELDEVGILEAELEENSIRVDLSWQETADAIGRLHKLRKVQNPDWSISDTNKELTEDVGTVTEQPHYPKTKQMVILSENLTNELVRNAKDPTTAMKLLRKQTSEHLSTTFADYLEVKGEEKEEPQVLNEDAIAHMNTHPDTYDVILTDPPYGVDAQAFNNFESGSSHDYDDSAENFQHLMSLFASSSYAATRENAHLYCFCDIRHWQFLRDRFEAAGWTVWNWPIIWVKTGHGLVPSAENGPSRQHELILFARKGNMKVTKVSPDVIKCASAQEKIHAAQKPIPLIKDLLSRSLNAGEGKVLDPFCGSGTTIAACRELKLDVVGCELDEVMYKRALIRIVTETGD